MVVFVIFVKGGDIERRVGEKEEEKWRTIEIKEAKKRKCQKNTRHKIREAANWSKHVDVLSHGEIKKE